MPERILILGPTGVNKTGAIENLGKYQGSLKNFHHIDFEKHCLFPANPGKTLHGYLNATQSKQIDYWKKGWGKLKEELDAHSKENILLSMHGVLVHPHYGVRSLAQIQSLTTDFNPTKIVTLITDVYYQWYRIQSKAGKREWHGNPTLEQLINARRAEIFLGDLVAANTSGHLEHYLLSIWHPVEVLNRILFEKSLKKAYLSFPISKPRKMENAGNMKGIEEINNFVHEAMEFQNNHNDVAFFCPLTIDEYPLNRATSTLKKQKDISGKTVDHRLFNTKNRWDMNEIYRGKLLLNDGEKLPPVIAIPEKQVKDVEGMIQTDVGWRDYRLVRQSDCLVVFNAYFKLPEEHRAKVEMSSGVKNEIRYALLGDDRLPCNIFQDWEHTSRRRKTFFKDGSENVGGTEPGGEYVTFYDTVSEALEAVLQCK